MDLSARLSAMKTRIRAGEHHRHRDTETIDVRSECDAEHLSWAQRAARLTRRMCEAQTVVIEPDEQIIFTRTVNKIAQIYSDAELRTLTAGRTMHELGPISNICADWGMVLSQGLLARKSVALATRKRLAANAEAVEFLDCAIETIDAVLALAVRYATAARQAGRDDVAALLERVPAKPATTFHEALQALRLCHAVLWLSGHYHCGLGRFDQYLWPYLRGGPGSGPA